MSKSSFMNDLTIWLFRKEYSPYFWKIREKAIKGNFISRYFHYTTAKPKGQGITPPSAPGPGAAGICRGPGLPFP